MLIQCKTVANMWERLNLIREQSFMENIHMLQHSFCEYKYTKGISVARHILEIKHLAQQVADFNEKFKENVITSRIVCSLPSSYRHVLTAWRRLPNYQQTRKILALRLFDEVEMNTVYGIMETDADKTLHAKNVGHDNLKDHKQDNEYIKNWRSKTKCNSCGEVGHQSRECPKKKNKIKIETTRMKQMLLCQRTSFRVKLLLLNL